MRFRALAPVAVAMLLQTGLAARQTPAPAPAPTAARSPRNANYTIHAALDPATHTIAGTEHLTWRNITSHPTSELRFHLYWNAWRDNNSSWMRERTLGDPSGLAARPSQDRSAVDITKFTMAGGANVLAATHFISPDDGNPDDRTVLAFGLARPVAPGESLDIDVEWTAHIPRPYARTGVIGDYYFIAQWFPKIGVLEDTGWNCHQFHSATEFFSDFGSYDVTLDTPRGWIVGATGVEQSAVDQPDGKTQHRFTQDDVHDFAWTTSPDYIERHETFDQSGLPPVDIRLLLQREHADQAERHFTATKVALGSYGSWFGAYPYGHITVVDPAANFDASIRGENTGGMEYPTLFTAGTRWLVPWKGLVPESVTIHEAGHQFWYGIVATNEFERAWMDEGFNTFSQARAIDEGLPRHFVAVERYFGGFIPWMYEDAPWSRDLDGNRLSAYRLAARSDVPATPTWQYWPPTASAITYNKTSLWLATLERYLGWPTLQRILSTYFERSAFQHPTPEQFFAIANEESHQDLTWFFDAVYRSAAVFDYGVGQVTVTPRVASGASGNAFDNLIMIRRYGDGIFPIEIRSTFADGATKTEQWDGKSESHMVEYAATSPVTRVEVDPNRVLLLDVNYTNNTWTSQPHAAAAAKKWSLRWMTWVEELMLSYGFFS